MTLSRRRFLVVAGAAAVAGCSRTGQTGAGSSGAEGSEGGSSTPSVTAGGTAAGDGSAPDGDGPPVVEQRLPLPMSPEGLREASRSGGPPKDGIPAIEDPSFVGADDADFLDPGDPVFGVARDGTAKAYPQKILVQHEICNDEIAGTPVSVTYCPLTGTAQGFERGATTFGVSGRLINNNLVMYDRAMETWWPQILATSIPGPWNADPQIRSLREFRLLWTTWGQWRDQHPDTRLLSLDTGFARNYNRDPYGQYNPVGGYYESSKFLFPPLEYESQFHPKTVVVGARTPDGAVAFRKESVLDEGILEGDLGSVPVVAVADHRYDTAYVYRTPDDATVEYRSESVAVDGTAHPPDELPLERVYAFDAMWFAWGGYYPDTAVYE